MSEKNKISYRAATAEVTEILKRIENGETDVDTLTSEIKRAAELLKTCREKLTHTEKEVDSVLRDLADTFGKEQVETKI
ncbi:MAG: exodeoxyribonuclease VII small subunit [Bacteroidales bacterium]|jgi:exodeoxyribonuclease VII small subunit|nr:exodeoxyribonuclease VII small subunit [Bacteroidales bacterium]